ncbi:MAG: FHA domain-containing protein [Pyrinomonadaceae bacterium]|nr:FHA domain-containing protein [Pyrinomonadaceae bacterium]
MKEYTLTYQSDEGVVEIDLSSGRVSFGRGSEAEYRFEDDGLSRLHATVYSEDGNVWIVDEASSNGTFVNGSPVSPSGEPLADGDIIKIGHHTKLRVAAVEKKTESVVTESVTPDRTVSAVPASGPSLVLPLAIIGVAFLLILSSIAVIGVSLYGSDDDSRNSSRSRDRDRDFEEDFPDDPSPSPSPEDTPGPNGTPFVETSPTPTPEMFPEDSGTPYPVLPKKKYREMTPAEQNLYIKVKAEKVARLIGNKSAGNIPPAAVASIKKWVDQYARRFRSNRLNDCSNRRTFTRSDMETVLQRASKNVPFITRSFRSQAIDPQVGIYVAMIESEHCVCLQSGTGPLGMFQFTYATGKAYGLAVRRGASPGNPDERCQPQPASLASAKYLKYLSGRIGTGPLSVPLAIASYNSGEGGLGRNLMTALTSSSSEERSFWTLVANAEKLSKQFKSENIKYVPKFFGAAIVGENPADFGSSLQPLSTYTR